MLWTGVAKLSGLLIVSASFSLPDSINLQDLLVTEHLSNPKNPDFKGEEHLNSETRIQWSLSKLHFKENVPKEMVTIQIFGPWLKWGFHE